MGRRPAVKVEAEEIEVGFDYDPVHLLHVPVEVQKRWDAEGKDGRWGDIDNLQPRLDQGWELTAALDTSGPLADLQAQNDSYIKRGRSVLMERPKEIGEKRAKAKAAQQNRLIQQLHRRDERVGVHGEINIEGASASRR